MDLVGRDEAGELQHLVELAVLMNVWVCLHFVGLGVKLLLGVIQSSIKRIFRK